MAVLAISVPLAILSFVLPGMFHAELVSAMGVLAANGLTTFATIFGGASAATFLGASGVSVRRAIARKRAADLAELESKEWNASLPTQDETNPDAIEPALRRIPDRYPEVAPLIKDTLGQLESIRQYLEKIGHILETNAGLLSRDEERYGNVEYLIKVFLAEFCPGLVRIVYQAHETTLVSDLKDVITEVNEENEARVNATRELANGVVEASTRGDTDSVMSQVQVAIKKLQTPTDPAKDSL